MKKVTVILAVLALVGASCTKIQIAESSDSSPSKGAISLSAYTAMPTKAAQVDVTNSNFTAFQVSAIGNSALYFDNVTFTKGTPSWVSDPVYFWPNFALTFCAYNTPANTTGFARTINKDKQEILVTPAADLAKQEDLVASYAKDKTEGDVNETNKAIDLKFNHYLTQVVVSALSSNSNYSVSVEGVKLANMADEGTYTFSTGNMVATTGKVNTDESVDYDEDFTARTLTTTAAEVMSDRETKDGRWYLIPQNVTPWKRVSTETTESATNEMTNSSNGTYLALKVKITSASGSKVYPKTGDDAAWMAVPVPEALKFEQGKKYNVTVKFFGENGEGGAGYVDPEYPGELDGDTSNSDAGKKILGGAIKFDATVSEWGDAVDITISL